MSLLSQPERFSFNQRPIPVPGDLRIEWRVSLIVLMLGHSRAKQASLAKLHILNDAIRGKQSAHLLDLVVTSTSRMLPWTFRIEPAFGRAIDFVVGDKFADWTQVSQRAGLKLSGSGSELFAKLQAEDDILKTEKAVLAIYAKSMTESAVGLVIGAKQRAI